ncbi:TPA: EAL domain-containing protein [Aeromonas veronii]|nr:EAL domain-containing protein [Aeromonas veronii]
MNHAARLIVSDGVLKQDIDCSLNQLKYLTLAFQPVVCLNTGGVSYYEALLRDSRGSLKSAPSALLMEFESSGKIKKLDEWVFGQVIDKLKARLAGVNVSVNMSAVTMSDPDCVARISDLAKKAGVSSRLIVEITETACFEDINKIKLSVQHLKRNDIKISLDDFGAGYSSFMTLANFDVDTLKIDGRYILDITKNVRCSAFIEGLKVMSSRGLGFKLVGECIETVEQLNACKQLGVDYGQGYYFSVPLMLD